METQWKEFEGKSIDEAIDEACEHFDSDRDKLEIEILSDSKTGIFGLGTKKAQVRARQRDTYAETKLLIQQTVERLVQPIVAGAGVSVEMDQPDRVRVHIDDEENSGLLIGREGQTLSSVQYLANRIVSRRLTDAPHIQIDVGDYRERQDENLREMATSLAEKAKELGKPQSTRPLSSYHRRVVHMALKTDETVQTRSKGEGPLKRVLILPPRSKQDKPEGGKQDGKSRGRGGRGRGRGGRGTRPPKQTDEQREDQATAGNGEAAEDDDNRGNR